MLENNLFKLAKKQKDLKINKDIYSIRNFDVKTATIESNE